MELLDDLKELDSNFKEVDVADSNLLLVHDVFQAKTILFLDDEVLPLELAQRVMVFSEVAHAVIEHHRKASNFVFHYFSHNIDLDVVQVLVLVDFDYHLLLLATLLLGLSTPHLEVLAPIVRGQVPPPSATDGLLEDIAFVDDSVAPFADLSSDVVGLTRLASN